MFLLGLSGGLVMMWKESVNMVVHFQSSNLIDCTFSSNGISFFYSFVYGFPNPSNRNDLWEGLERIGTTRKGQPWRIMGDFNELLGNNEKRGGRIRSEASFVDMRRIVRNCNFTDLKSIGDRFYWAGQRGDHYVTCCLDRTMANNAWLNLFPASVTEFLEFGESDHRPLVTRISETEETKRGFFIYDSRMTHKDGFNDSMLKGWNEQAGNLQHVSLTQRISLCQKQIAIWKRKYRINATENIAIARHALDKAIANGGITTAERAKLRKNLNEAYIFWKNKSRNRWMNVGDRNTKYFHSVAKTRKPKNRINAIQDDFGEVKRRETDIAEVAVKYFQNLYSSSQ